jgi:hypothetical protein
MSRSLRGAVVLMAAAGTLALGGCRGAVAAAPSPGAVSPGSSGAVSPGGLTQGATAGGGSAGTSADPLGSVEASLDAIEKQVDQDGTG